MDVRDNPNRKVVRIPLAGVENARIHTSSKDQQYQGWTFDKIENPLTGKTTLYCQKTPIPSSSIYSLHPSASYTAISFLNLESWTGTGIVAGFYNYTSTASALVFYNGSIDVDMIASGIPYYLTETRTANAAGTLTTIVLVGCNDNTYWIIPTDALTSLTFTANTNSNTTINNISSMAGLWVGQIVTGTDIPANTRITAIDYAGNSITISNAATGTTVGVTVTRTIIAKIIDSDFPTDAVGPMAVMNGYTYVMTTSGKIYNSDLNSVTSWSANNYISAQQEPDRGVGVFKYKNTLVAFGQSSIEFFEDVGNPLGSPLKNVPGKTIRAGCILAKVIYVYGDIIYFLGSTNPTNRGLFKLENFNLKVYKDTRLDTFIRDISTGSSLGALLRFTSISIQEKDYLLIAKGSNDTSGYNNWIFDLNLEVFTSAIYNASSENLTSISASIMSDPSWQSVGEKDVNLILLANTDYLYSIDTTYGIGNEIRTSPLDFGVNNLKRIHKFRLIGDQDTTTNTMTISWSDNDGQNFSTARTVSMGSANPTLVNLGNAFRRRIFKIVSSTARAVRLEAIEIEYSELDH